MDLERRRFRRSNKILVLPLQQLPFELFLRSPGNHRTFRTNKVRVRPGPPTSSMGPDLKVVKSAQTDCEEKSCPDWDLASEHGWVPHLEGPLSGLTFLFTIAECGSVTAAWALRGQLLPRHTLEQGAPLPPRISLGLSPLTAGRRPHSGHSSIRTFPTRRKRSRSATIFQLFFSPTSSPQLQDPLVTQTHGIAPPACGIKRVAEHGLPLWLTKPDETSPMETPPTGTT